MLCYAHTVQLKTFYLQVLDAPGLVDDFYANVLDWSQQGLLAVALGCQLYVYNTVTSKASHLKFVNHLVHYNLSSNGWAGV